MPWGAGAAVVGGLAGAKIQGDAAKSAAKIGAQSSEAAALEARLAREEARKTLAPYVEAGLPALSDLVSGLGEESMSMQFLQSLDPSMLPGYDFLKREGLESVQNSYAARGLGSSVPAIEGAVKFSEDLASTYALDWFRAMQGEEARGFDETLALATLGQNAAAGTGANAIRTGETLGDLIIGSGEARAAGKVAGANATAGGINQLSQIALLQAIGAFG